MATRKKIVLIGLLSLGALLLCMGVYLARQARETRQIRFLGTGTLKGVHWFSLTNHLPFEVEVPPPKPPPTYRGGGFGIRITSPMLEADLTYPHLMYPRYLALSKSHLDRPVILHPGEEYVFGVVFPDWAFSPTFSQGTIVVPNWVVGPYTWGVFLIVDSPLIDLRAESRPLPPALGSLDSYGIKVGRDPGETWAEFRNRVVTFLEGLGFSPCPNPLWLDGGAISRSRSGVGGSKILVTSYFQGERGPLGDPVFLWLEWEEARGGAAPKPTEIIIFMSFNRTSMVNYPPPDLADLRGTILDWARAGP